MKTSYKLRILTEPIKTRTIGGDFFRLYRRVNANRYGKHVISFLVRLAYLSGGILCFSGAATLALSPWYEADGILGLWAIVLAFALILFGVFLCIKPLTYK